MAYSNDYISIPGLLAGADLSSAQYKVVKLASTAGEVVVVTATTDNAIGVLQNDPADGEPAEVAVYGVCKAIAGPTDVAFGDLLGYDTTARVADHTTDNRPIVARALEASSAAGDIISVFVDGFSKRY